MLNGTKGAGGNMSNRIDKPKMSAADLAHNLAQHHGITFNRFSETDAAAYFSNRNNFLRTASYRKNYPKHTSGANVGKYIGLDFLSLVELSTLDMHLRRILLRMCIDVEHALKVRLVADVENDPAQDGYQIVEDFLNNNASVLYNIENKIDAIFTGDLISKYFTICQVFQARSAQPQRLKQQIVAYDCPVWVLVEIISFGDFIKLAEFYYAGISNNLYDRSIINPVRSLRNACAHNNCLLNSLNSSSTTAPSAAVSQFVAGLGLSRSSSKRNLSTRPILEIVCLLYEYTNAVSDKVRNAGLSELSNFLSHRAIEKKNLLIQNPLLVSRYNYLKAVVDHIK